MEALRFTFELNDILDWPFDFWDPEGKPHVRKKLERLNGFSKDVHVIRLEVGEIDTNKRRRLPDGFFTVTTVEVIAAVEEEPQLCQVDLEKDNLPPSLVGSSRVSGTVEAQNPERLTTTLSNLYFYQIMSSCHRQVLGTSQEIKGGVEAHCLG